MKKTIVQISTSNDGLRKYVPAVHDKGSDIVLLYSSDAKTPYERGKLLGEPEFDEVIFVDNPEPENFLRIIREIQKKSDLKLIIPGSELYTPMAANFSEELELPTPGSSIVEKFRLKSKQRQAMSDAGLDYLQPKSIRCETLVDVLAAAKELNMSTTNPVVIKPDDSGGGMGVQKVGSEAECKEAVRNLNGLKLDNGCNSNGVILVEEFIDAPEIEILGVVDANGKVNPLSMVKKTFHHGKSGNRFLENSFTCHPQPDILILQKVHETIQEIIQGLGLTSSPIQMDMRLSPNGPKLIEAGARLSGGFLLDLAERATGWNLASIALDVMLGNSFKLPPCTNYYSGVHFITPQKAGYIGAYNLSLSSLGLTEEEDISVNLFNSNYAFAGGYQHISDRLGVVRVTATSPERVKQLIQMVISRLQVTYKI